MQPVVSQEYLILSQINDWECNTFLVFINVNKSVDKLCYDTITIHSTISISCWDRDGEFLGIQKGPFYKVSVDAACHAAAINKSFDCYLSSFIRKFKDDVNLSLLFSV